MKKSYLEMSKDELLNEYSSVKKDYDALKAQGISIDMSRGKPASDQLDLSNGMLTVLDDGNFKCEAGVDVRNYGVLSGIPSSCVDKSISFNSMPCNTRGIIYFLSKLSVLLRRLFSSSAPPRI